MNFSEFKRLLGSDPDNRDPEFLHARESSPEFVQAAADSDRLEHRLRRALDVPVPTGFVDSLKVIPHRQRRNAPPLRFLALAASVVLALAAAVFFWRAGGDAPSVEQYVIEHFHHDGPMVLERGENQIADNVQSLLAQFDLSMSPEAAARVGYIMICPTPDGVGVHFMVHTPSGPVTVIVMPKTRVDDGKRFAFDGMHAQLVALNRGSAAIVVRTDQDIGTLHEHLRASIGTGPVGS